MEVLELMSANKHVHSVLLKNYPGLAHSRSFSQPLTSSRHSNGPHLPFDSLSPTAVDENGLVRTKSRHVRNEEAFLEWLKHDPNLQHSKNVQMMMVSDRRIFEESSMKNALIIFSSWYFYRIAIRPPT